MVVDLIFARVQSVGGRKPDQFECCRVLVSTDRCRSFCRKTTLTKHFRRWHTDEETSSEEGSDVGPDDIAEEPIARQSSYYGDLWPLPGQSAQQPRPLSFQATLVSRPKSTESSSGGGNKGERGASVSPSADQNLAGANAAMTSFEYLRARAGVTPEQILVHAALPANFHHGLPVSGHYTSENGIETWISPIETKTSSSFSEYSPTPSSAQSSSLYFNESSTTANYPLQVANIALNDPLPYAPDGGATVHNTPTPLAEGISQGQMQAARYSLGPTSAPEQPMQFSAVPLSISQQPQPTVMPVSFAVNAQYNIPNDPPQYYGGTVPDWYLNVKPEESWPGALPTDYYWN